MKAATNAASLISQVLIGEVWPPLADRHGVGNQVTVVSGPASGETGHVIGRPRP